MRLHRIAVEHVRGIPAAEVRFGDGVTVVEAPNEAGKSSLFEAFGVLLHEKVTTTRQRVKDLQPRGSDVGSYVEAELTIGATHLTVSKRFNRQRSTELVVHAPSRRQLTGDEAHAELRRLLEQGTDLALFEALRFEQGRPLGCVEGLANSEQLARQLDASAGGSGEAGDDALHDRVVAEFQRYFTPRGQDGRALKEAVAAVADADEEVERLQRVATELAAAAGRVEQLERERARLDQLLADLQPAVKEHQRQLQRVATLRAELRTAHADAHAAASDLERARHELTAREDQAEAILRLEQRLDGRERDARRAREDLVAHEERLERLAAAVAQAETIEAEARRARAAARASADLATRRDELWHLRERQRRVHEALQAAEIAAAFLAAHPMTGDQLTRIHDAADRVRLLEARVDDAAPTVRVRARQDVEVVVDGDPTALPADGELERSVPDALALRIGELADLEVRAGTSLEERRAEADAARRELAEACDTVGVGDPDQADQLARDLREHRRTIEHRDTVLERELDGITREQLDDRVRRLQTQVTELEDRLRGDDEQLSLVADATTEGVAELEAAEDAARATLADRRAEHAALAAQVQQLRDHATVADAALAHDADQLASARERLQQDRTRRSDEVLASDLRDAEKARTHADDAVAGAADELERLAPDQVEMLAANADAQLSRATADLDAVREELATVRATIEVRGGQGIGEALDAARAEQARVHEAAQALRGRAAAARVLKETFESARDAAYGAYREPLRERIVRAGRLVFGPDLDVELDEELRVVSRTLGGTTLPFEQLSAGAREQLAILTALAAADLAGEGGVPLVLDDTLGYTDPERLERLGAVLGRVRGPQVIVLTCVGARFQAVGGAEVVRLREVTQVA